MKFRAKTNIDGSIVSDVEDSKNIEPNNDAKVS